MIDQEAMTNMRGHWDRELKRIPGVRWWKLGEPEWEGFSLLGCAWLEARLKDGLRFAGEEFQKLVQQTVEAIPALRQPKVDAPPAIPKPWVNPVTGQPLGMPKTPGEKGVLAKKDPQLLRLMQDLEKHPYQTVVRLQEEAERHARLAAIQYGSDEDSTNDFYGTDLQAHAALVRDDPERAEVFKREAAIKVKIPWLSGKHDPDGMGRLVTHAPDVAKLANRATELMRQRAKEQADQAQAEIEAAQKKLSQAKKLAA